MNIAKNMEAIFLVTIALAGATSLATAAVPVRAQAPAGVVAVAAGVPFAGTMQVVTVSAKRLSAADKARDAQ